MLGVLSYANPLIVVIPITSRMGRNRYWQTTPGQLFLWEKWKEESVVYNSLSGETHYLNQMATLVLEFLEQAPHTAWTLTEAVSKTNMGEDVEFLNQQIQRLLEEFDGLGLIEPAE